ncbi:uncharacterized protein LOC6733112 isoform X2 [Drosophila simulans]|uniref:Uncharacterized protein, isoform C n=1 Tax=Drosophila simulans TaxID=7240 RepID=A0A0J9R599_DROSI|nr:uncharacterized protein LOC6733112 isoform X2 [Drosophila simulans]KMY91407.1 uncharacterized protein Dsimw501_GD21622, isoform C [Drosophila simulans]
MSRSEENEDKVIPLTNLENAQKEDEKAFRYSRRNGHHTMAAAASSVNLGITEPSEASQDITKHWMQCCAANEKARSLCFGDATSRTLSKSLSVRKAVPQTSSSQSSFVYKPFDYTLHGLTDFDSTMSSARTSSSQSQDLLRKENYRFESSATGLDDDGDSNDIFCSTMKDPQDIPTFLSDECEIDSMDSPKKNKNPQNRPAKFTITAYEDNAKDHFSDLEQNRVQPVDKGLYVKESEKGSDHFICQQHKKNILEPGELSEDDTSEAQKVRCAYKTSDLEDGEVSCEGLDVPHNLIKKTSLCQFDNTIFKKRNISVDKKHDQVESVDLEDGELFGEDNEVSSNTIKKEDNRMPFCRYHIRNSCIWGQNCRFRHPNLNKLGKYVMFEKKCLPVPTVTFPPVWSTCVLPARDTYPMAVIETMSRMPESLDISFGMNNMDNDPYYTQNEPEVDKRAPLLQTPTFSELLTEQKQYHNSLAGNRPIRTPPPARYSRNLRSTVQANRSSFLTCLEKRDRSPRLPRYSASKNPQPQISLSNIRRPSSIIVRLERKRQRLSDSTFSSSDSSESSSYESTTESTDDVSSFSESDARGEKNSSSSLGIPIKNMKRNEEKFSSDAVAKFTAKRPHSPKFRNQKQTFSKLSTKTPLRNPPNVLPNAPKKPHSILESSYSIKKKQDRQKRLLMQLLRVEQQIAKKKKHRMKAFKE